MRSHKRKSRLIAIFAIFICSAIFGQAFGAPSSPVRLRINYAVAPIGITDPSPVFSWELLCVDRASGQTAYQVRVGSNPGSSDLWNSGWIQTDRQNGIEYKGLALQSNTVYWWSVNIRDKNGVESGFAADVSFQTGIFTTAEWSAHRIARFNDTAALNLIPMFRKEFNITGAISRATAYVGARGWIQLFVNGQRVGNDALSPIFSPYRSMAVAYDVTSLLQNGLNAVGIVLSRSDYHGIMGYKGPKTLFFELRATLAGGQEIVVVSDSSWKVTVNGPFMFTDNGLHNDCYDASREISGWSETLFVDTSWEPVVDMGNPTEAICGQLERMEVMDTLPALSSKMITATQYSYDFGQYFTGWLQASITKTRGTSATVAFNGPEFDGGTTYYFRSSLKELFHQQFGYGNGSGAVVRNVSYQLALQDVKGLAVYCNTGPLSEFSCSNSLVTRLYRGATFAQRGNLSSVVWDTPHRKEGAWLFDLACSAEAFCQNFDMSRFFIKWADDMHESQGVNGGFANVAPPNKGDGASMWSSAYNIAIYEYWRAYGDTTLLRRWYPNIRKNADLYLKNYSSGVMGCDYCDWNNTQKEVIGKNELGSLLLYRVADNASRMAAALGEPADAQRYSLFAAKVRTVYNQQFLVGDHYPLGYHTGNGGALFFGIVPDSLRDTLTKWLTADIAGEGYHLTTGVPGAWLAMNGLSYAERPAVTGYRLVSQTTAPSWGDQLLNYGATGSREFFNGGSYSHHWLGSSLVDWCTRVIGGVDVLEPGYKKFRVAPQPVDDLTWAKYAIHTVRGQVSVDWKIQANVFQLLLTVPPNAQAEVELPTYLGIPVDIYEGITMIWKNGAAVGGVAGVTWIRNTATGVVFEAASGSYDFSFAISGTLLARIPHAGPGSHIRLSCQLNRFLVNVSDPQNDPLKSIVATNVLGQTVWQWTGTPSTTGIAQVRLFSTSRQENNRAISNGLYVVTVRTSRGMLRQMICVCQ